MNTQNETKKVATKKFNLEINTIEKNCIDVNNHNCRIEVHTRVKDLRFSLEESEQIAKRIVDNFNSAPKKSIMKEMIYFCATENRTWGKGISIIGAKIAANAGTKGYVIWGAIFEEFDNEEDRKNIRDCITADQISGNPVFYSDNRTEEDSIMIEKYLIGWSVIEDTTNK